MPPTDQRGQLAARPYTYRTSQDQKIFIAWHGQVVTILKGPAAAKLIAQLAAADDRQTQLLLARATGHFKHGTERRGPTPR